MNAHFGFTVVIATFNRPRRLEGTMAAVRAAVEAAGGGHRLVVVDNGAAEPAEEAVARFARDGGFPVRYLRSPPGNKAAALNAGIRAAETEWIAFTDDDCLPDADWLRRGVAYAAEGRVNVFGGRIVPLETGMNLPRWLCPGRTGRRPTAPSLVEYAPLPASGMPADGMRVPLGANVFVKKAVFERYGGYDEALWRRCGAAALGSEDGELGLRLRRAGEPIGYCAEAVVRHPVLPGRATLRNHLRYAWLMGYREPLLPGVEPASARHLAKRFATAIGRGALRGMTADWPEAVIEMQKAAFAAGYASGRKRLAVSRDEGNGTADERR